WVGSRALHIPSTNRVKLPSAPRPRPEGGAFLYSAGKTINIGGLGAGLTEVFGPSAINKYGQIVVSFELSMSIWISRLCTPLAKGWLTLNKLIPKHLGLTLVEAWGLTTQAKLS